MSNHQLGKELHKTVIRKLDKRKIRQYACVIPLKDKKGIAITNPFQKVLDESDHNSNKIWVDRGSEYYNRSMKSWLKDNDIEIYEHIMLLLKIIII